MPGQNHPEYHCFLLLLVRRQFLQLNNHFHFQQNQSSVRIHGKISQRVFGCPIVRRLCSTMNYTLYLFNPLYLVVLNPETAISRFVQRTKVCTLTQPLLRRNITMRNRLFQIGMLIKGSELERKKLRKARSNILFTIYY